MPLPLIVVEIPAQDRAAPESSVLLEACTKGLGSGRCELTEPANAGPVSAIAIVSWRDEDRLSALVEVARVQQREGWRSEELRFKAEDRRIERFRTLGLAIATLFREASLPQSSEEAGTPSPAATVKQQSAPAQREEAKSARAKPSAAKAKPNNAAEAEQAQAGASTDARDARRGAQAWLSAGALAAYDPELRDWNYGGELRLAVGAAAFPGFVSALGSYSSGPDLGEVSLDWATLGAGPGLRFNLSPSVELRGVVHAVAVDVSGRASEQGRISRQNAWVPGVGLALELALHAGGRLSGAVGAQVQQLAGNVPIREHEQLVGTVGKTTLGITLTLEFHLLGQAGSAD
jgi:hypothetical protein